MEERPTKADGNACCRYHSRSSEKPNRHWKCGNRFAAWDNLWLQCHEETYTSAVKLIRTIYRFFNQLMFYLLIYRRRKNVFSLFYSFFKKKKSNRSCSFLDICEGKKRKKNIPKLNIAIPRPASERIDMEPLIIVGISMPHLKIM